MSCLRLVALLLLSAGCRGTVCEEYPLLCGTSAQGGSGGTGGEAGTGGSGGTGGNTGGDGGTGGGPNPTCTPTEGEAIGAMCGVFVDASNGGGNGSLGSPYDTITAAVQNLGNAEHIYVCGSDTFVGSITLPSGVSLSGGLTCGSWVYAVANARPVLAGDADIPAISLIGAGETVLTSLRIEGAAPSASGGSSIGLLASERTVEGLLIDVIAAAGNAGTPGADAAQTNALNGGTGTIGNNAPACNVGGLNDGGMETLNATCATGSSVGGKGGDATPSQGTDGQPGTPGTLGQAGLGQPSSGMGWSCGVGVGGGGNNGSAGSPGSPGSPGSGKGALMSTGFSAASGGLGGNGDPGQGGGGGGGSRGLLDCNAGMAGSQPRTGASGGSGGAGGCGGVGAAGGTGGGSSLAVVLLNAPANFTDSTFTSGDGGAGGDGGRGQPAAAGGFGANGGVGDIANGIENACRGGDGGTGGRGGGGGGGRGGHSAAIVYDGVAPTLEGGTTAQGAAGAGGLGQGLNPGGAGTLGASCALLDFTAVVEVCAT